MTTIVPLTISIGEGPALTYEINGRGTAKACFALGVRKSGSSIFSSIVGAIAMFNEKAIVDIPGTMFAAGHRYPDWNGYARITDLLWRDTVYIGFRDPPTSFYADPVFREGRKILMVRDPRDALVSEYFSNAFSHSLPTVQSGGSVIEEERQHALRAGVEGYALKRVSEINRTVAGYRNLLKDPNLLIMRYEDVIFDKARWIGAIAKHFDLQISDELVGHILGWADVRPDQEDPKAFIRRVAPGDHLDKLSPEAINRIDRQLSDVWSGLGYVVGG